MKPLLTLAIILLATPLMAGQMLNRNAYGVRAAAVYPDWTPISLTNLAMWVDASNTNSVVVTSSNTVSQWSDISGRGKHLTQATGALQPTYTNAGFNGKPAIVWPNGVNSLRLDTATMTYRHIFMAYSFADGSRSTWYQEYQTIIGVGLTYPGLTAQAGSGNWWWGFNPFNLMRKNGNTETDINSTVALPVNKAIISVKGDVVKVDQLKIGNDRNNAGRSWSGPIAEIVVCSNLVAQADIEKVEGYLSHKWLGSGALNNLPANHPYKNNAPKSYQ